MANFAKIEVAQKTDNLIKRSVVIHARRYLPQQKRWSVKLNTGWVMDDIRNGETHSFLSKEEAKSIATNWLHPH